MSDVPRGWATAPVLDIVSLHDSRRVPLNATQRAAMKGAYPYYGANGLVDHVNDYLFDGHYVLLAEDGGYFDDPSRGVAYEVSGRFWVNNHAHILQSLGDIPHRFLTIVLNATNWLPYVGGSTRLKLTQGGLQQVPIALPPLPEQRRIVGKIDSLTAKSARARDRLDHIPRLVEKYKEATLAAAFSGELVGLSTGKTEQPHHLCWDLPPSWCWVRFHEVVKIASNLVQPEEILELPHIAPDNVESRTGRLLPFRTIREDGVISSKHRFYAGQVIYSKIRPYLRKAVMVDFDGACSADMYPLEAGRGLDPEFLVYWLISEPFSRFTVEHEGRTVLPKINQQGLNQTPLPLPPINDQKATARRIRNAFAWIDRVAGEATSARKLVDHLDQAALAKAFRGELVSQDPNDEPASVLLERIRAERGALTSQPRSRGRKGKTA